MDSESVFGPNSNWNKYTGLKDPTCALKFVWSSVKLKEGTSASCHRTKYDKIPEGDFGKFHHTPNKIATRKLMLDGIWPTVPEGSQEGCEYCKKMEDVGAISDRMDANSENKKYFTEPDKPECTMMEIYFSNLCNQACVYCSAEYSTTWEAENKKFGLKQNIQPYALEFFNDEKKYQNIIKEFWEWLEHGIYNLAKLNILGGEPFFQPQFEDLLDFFETHPCPNLDLTIFSNLKVRPKKFRELMDRIQFLSKAKFLGHIRIICSIDSWGPSFEYIRWGGNCKEWEKNFSILCQEYPEIEPELHMTMNAMSIKTQPELVAMANKYNTKDKFWKVHLSANFVVWPFHMIPELFPKGFFAEDFKRLYKEIDAGNWHDSIKKMMQGYEKAIDDTPVDYAKINKLKEELTDIDRRRGCDWKKTFPWLDEFKSNINMITL